MKEGNRCVMLHWEKSMRHGDKNPSADADHFGDEETLVFGAADVLENRIRGDNVE